MKFSEMTYTRPDPTASKQRLSALTAELKAAKSYEEARKVFLSQPELMSHISTAATLASIRHSIDTRDKFYDGEEKFWNNFNPELEEYNQAWTAATFSFIRTAPIGRPPPRPLASVTTSGWRL